MLHTIWRKFITEKIEQCSMADVVEKTVEDETENKHSGQSGLNVLYWQ